MIALSLPSPCPDRQSPKCDEVRFPKRHVTEHAEPLQTGFVGDYCGLIIRKGTLMAFEDLDAEITYLLDVMEGDQGDLREIEFRLRQALAMLRAEGLPVPEDLEKFEAALDKLLSR
jgi:hypothetical protein